MSESVSAVCSFGVPHQTSLSGVSLFSNGTPVGLSLLSKGQLHLQQVGALEPQWQHSLCMVLQR